MSEQFMMPSHNFCLKWDGFLQTSCLSSWQSFSEITVVSRGLKSTCQNLHENLPLLLLLLEVWDSLLCHVWFFFEVCPSDQKSLYLLWLNSACVSWTVIICGERGLAGQKKWKGEQSFVLQGIQKWVPRDS